MINNIELLNACFEHLEKYSDDEYIHNDCIKPIITDNPNNLNALMKANISLIENVSAYKVAKESGNSEMMKTSIDNIIKALGTKGMNCSEFTSYWAVRDMSYSIFDKTLNSHIMKQEFINDILPHYIKDRHYLYTMHGYSPTVLQAVFDSKAHKTNGESGLTKVSNILNNLGFTHFGTDDIDTFIKSNNIYIYPDKTDKELFKKILGYYGIEFKWSPAHENKQTDFLIKSDGKLYIMEHKHMKELGGGQDKQMTEIIDFVGYKDIDEVSYISFLDGIYFNVLAHSNATEGGTKQENQRYHLLKNLKENPQNYFVNTFGFTKLMKSILKID